jgi:hypothetical protein
VKGVVERKEVPADSATADMDPCVWGEQQVNASMKEQY